MSIRGKPAATSRSALRCGCSASGSAPVRARIARAAPTRRHRAKPWCAPPADEGRLKSGSLYNRFDAALGPAFDDGPEPVDLNLCYEVGGGQTSSAHRKARPAVHPWDTYRTGPFDRYFAALAHYLDEPLRSALAAALGGAIPEAAGFGGMAGFPFHGIKDSALSAEPAYDLKKLSTDNLLSGIGPHGELVLRFRRVGDMTFETGTAYQRRWPFKWTGTKTRPHPNEAQLWKNKMKESYFDADLDDRCRGLYGQEVRRTKPDRLADYLVCAPFVAAWEYAEGPAEGRAENPSGTLAHAFLNARQDGCHRAFSEDERALLAALPRPGDPYDAAAAIGAALIRFALGTESLPGAARAILGAGLASQSAYLESLRDWALEISERDGASSRTESLEEVYVAPPFAETHPVDWLLDEHAPRHLLLQAGSGMGKSTFLRALAAACASARADLLTRLMSGNAPRSAATAFAEALAASAEGAPCANGNAPASAPDTLAERMARLASYTPVLLSQTRDEGLYRRLTGADGLPPASFEEFAFAALPPLTQSIMRHAACAGKNGADASENPLSQLMQRADVLLMVDSIDEIPRRYRPLYLRRLKEFAERAGTARLLVASRPLPPDDTESLMSLLGADTAFSRLAPFDLARQEDLFSRVTSRGGADAYAGPSFEQVSATAGLSGAMGNPFMLTAAALELKRHRDAAHRGAWWLFSQINDRFRKRATLNPHDRAALERLAFDLAVGNATLPAAEFIERFRRYRNDEASFQSGGTLVLELDEDEVCDLIMSRLGIIDVCVGEVGFPYAAMKGFWASLWVRRCVERAQGMPKSLMDIEGHDDEAQLASFERGAAAGAKLAHRLLCASAAAEGGTETADDAALLALMFSLEYAGSRAHPDHPAFDLMEQEVYRNLLTACLLGEEGESRAAVRALRTAATFGFGHPLGGYEEHTGRYRPRLSAFAEH